MKRIFAGILIFVAASVVCSAENMKCLTERVFDIAKAQALTIDARLGADKTPKTIDSNGVPEDAGCINWCAGFFPGTCWYIYEYTGDPQIRSIAEKNTHKLKEIPYKYSSHDIGFVLWCSYGNAWRITGDKSWLEVPVAGAKALAGRFNENAKTIKSWDSVSGKDWLHPVIIDNMMNLELLEEMSKLLGEKRYDEIARTHANTTLANHFRKDNSCFHVVDYDPRDGRVRHRVTRQGFNDASAWSRGQAWALYGYTMMFRETGDSVYLEHARKVASYLLSRLPKDGIPYWDFDDPAIPYTYRDASAAAVMASAFIELSHFEPEAGKARSYIRMARRQIRTLASPEYLAEPGTNAGFLLKHSVGSLPAGKEINVPLSYADYYFLEALLRYHQAFSVCG